jgi:hypothetical protein
MTLREWRAAKVRYVGWGPKPLVPYHVTLTPHFGFSLPWPGGRLRYAPHHGLQFVQWTGVRWRVSRQFVGKSRVKGEDLSRVRK